MGKQNKKRPSGYMGEALALAQKAMEQGIIQPGAYYEVAVVHEDHCTLLKGLGYCNCNPVVKPPERVPMVEEN